MFDVLSKACEIIYLLLLDDRTLWGTIKGGGGGGGGMPAKAAGIDGIIGGNAPGKAPLGGAGGGGTVIGSKSDFGFPTTPSSFFCIKSKVLAPMIGRGGAPAPDKAAFVAISASNLKRCTISC